MNAIDPYLLIRAGALYLPLVATTLIGAIRKPSRPELTGAFLSLAWSAPAILALNVLAVRLGWWTFHAKGGLLLGMPVDLWLGWAVLWGALPALAFSTTSVFVVSAMAIALDLVLMPAAFPVVRLGPTWLLGEFVGIAICLVPAQLLSRWTAGDRCLRGRALLQVFAFSAFLAWLIPLMAIENTGGMRWSPLEHSAWLVSLVIQALALPAIVGLSAVQEFALRGNGTPIPFDPPKRLVTTGIYAYIANPMQMSAAVLLAAIGVAIGNVWIVLGAMMAVIYSMGIANWDEQDDLRKRFGAPWVTYRTNVPRWLPRLRPWYSDDAVATLYVSDECDMCREVARWYQRRGVRGLAIVPAEEHPRGGLTRITYESNDGRYQATGLEAVARALEHVHLGWAFAGAVLRLPIVSPLVQLIIDASGGGPRHVRRRPVTCVSVSPSTRRPMP